MDECYQSQDSGCPVCVLLGLRAHLAGEATRAVPETPGKDKLMSYTYTFDQRGLYGYAFTLDRPVLRYGTCEKKRWAAHCPCCDTPLLDFIHDERLVFGCLDCCLIWPTE